MEGTPTFVIGHLSDLHFSQERESNDVRAVHSIDQLRGIEAVMKERSFDRVIISGDITNDGHPGSLLNASNWIFKRLSIDSDEEIGLQLPPENVGIVPGNHDAFNYTSVTRGALVHAVIERVSSIVQRGLENYYSKFKEHHLPDGIKYDYLEKAGRGLLLIYLDTCHLGGVQ